MSVAITFLTILFITATGFLIIKGGGFLPKSSNLFILSLGYGLGVGIVYIQLFLYSHFGVIWTRETLLPPWIVVLVLLLVFARNNHWFHTFKKEKMDFVEKALIVGIMLIISYTLFEALLRPVTTWDGWASWLLKSKVFFIDGNINLESLSYVGSEYPLVIPLLGTFIYIVLGYVNDTAVLLMSFAFYLFLSLAFFSALKKDYGTKYALFATFLLMTIQNLVRHGGRIESGQADLPFGYCVFTSTILLLEYYKTNSKKVLLLLSIFLGITGLIKVEGVPFTCTIVLWIIYNIYKKRTYNHIWILFCWILPIITWNLYKIFYHLLLVGDRTLLFYPQSYPGIFYRIIQEFLNIRTWNIIWIFYFLLLIVWPKNRGKNVFIINCIIFSQLIWYLFAYLFFKDFNPESSMERLLVHIVALALFVIMVRVRSLI